MPGSYSASTGRGGGPPPPPAPPLPPLAWPAFTCRPKAGRFNRTVAWPPEPRAGSRTRRWPGAGRAQEAVRRKPHAASGGSRAPEAVRWKPCAGSRAQPATPCVRSRAPESDAVRQKPRAGICASEDVRLKQCNGSSVRSCMRKVRTMPLKYV